MTTADVAPKIRHVILKSVGWQKTAKVLLKKLVTCTFFNKVPLHYCQVACRLYISDKPGRKIFCGLRWNSSLGSDKTSVFFSSHFVSPISQKYSDETDFLKSGLRNSFPKIRVMKKKKKVMRKCEKRRIFYYFPVT